MCAGRERGMCAVSSSILVLADLFSEKQRYIADSKTTLHKINNSAANRFHSRPSHACTCRDFGGIRSCVANGRGS